MNPGDVEKAARENPGMTMILASISEAMDQGEKAVMLLAKLASLNLLPEEFQLEASRIGLGWLSAMLKIQEKLPQARAEITANVALNKMKEDQHGS